MQRRHNVAERSSTLPFCSQPQPSNPYSQMQRRDINKATRKALLSAAVMVGLSQLVSTASAADLIWTGLGTGNTWSDPGNWVGGVAPNASGGDQVFFDGNTQTITVNDYAANTAFNGIQFAANASSFRRTIRFQLAQILIQRHR